MRGGLALAIALVSRGVVRLWHVPNARGNSEHNLLKNAEGRPFSFSICPTLNLFSLSPSCHEAVHLSTWEVFV